MSLNSRSSPGTQGDFDDAAGLFGSVARDVGRSQWTRAAHDAALAEARSITEGLMRAKPVISPTYFYDERGSELFEQITRLPEYYLTRVERSIVQRHGEAITQSIGAGAVVIEPGAGNCEKARGLCQLIAAREFVGIDISSEHLQDAVRRLRADMPWLRARAVAADITQPVRLPRDVPRERRLVFYPGSSIGNFVPAQAVQLLTRMRQLSGSPQEGGSLLIGIDLPKPVHVLQAAYDDAGGVTAAFNRNALVHLNRRIGSDFDPDGWRHRAFFDATHSRVEMHLVAQTAQRVRWPGGGRDFAAGDRIHTENSYKHSLENFASLLTLAGFREHRSWTDEQGWFALIHAKQ
ncbi:L-histidine N(alpha)-methyltransferase [Diaphorobacter caeni]|uniref:L-histidine N(alpha)-methyltransferase n=1 Tax=Diaphorobacter caeni TaxID=2784387 RepID=UPI00188E29A4|nr:L-histidine N(alpha)-methyltransferase [Diaphorobacter caeni]MBF5004498.1 L-histidine N(alpha)-methyltransferase [Diaphorobacter caeni]